MRRCTCRIKTWPVTWTTQSATLHHQIQPTPHFTRKRDHKSDFALITETWFSDKQSDTKLSMPGYHLFRFDRKSPIGGGVCIYVCNNYSECIAPTPLTAGIEVLWLECTVHGQLYYTVCCYHPQSLRMTPIYLLLNSLQMCIALLNVIQVHYRLYPADFNHPDVSFLEIQFGFSQLVSYVTLGNTGWPS